jgi:hypothetical protein
MNDELSTDGRREGFLVGAIVGAALGRSTAVGPRDTRVDGTGGGVPQPAPSIPSAATNPPPTGRRRAPIALSDGLLQELVSGGVDLERLSGRWVEWLSDDGLDADPALFEALGHLREFNAPIEATALRGPAALAAVLPAALASASPKSMLSGAFHTARMLDPDPDSALSAAAVVIAASRLLEGSRDFVPDTLAMLRTNNADETLFGRFVAIAADPRTSPPVPVGVSPTVTDVAVWVLWQVQHRRRSAELLTDVTIRGEVSSTTASILAALLGARDGIGSWPNEWLEGAGEEVVLRRGLAKQLNG